MTAFRLPLIALLAALPLIATAQNSGTIEQPSITVTGQATVTEPVELIDLNARLNVRNEDSATAVRDLNRRVQRLVSDIEDRLEGELRLVVDDFGIAPNYQHAGGERKIRDYEASQSVNIQRIGIGDVESWLTLVSEHAPDRLQLANGRALDEDHEHRALVAAVKNAQSKAHRIAEHSGGDVGRVLRVTEESSSQPRPQTRAMMASDGPESSAPVFRPDDTEHRAQVRVIFELITPGN